MLLRVFSYLCKLVCTGGKSAEMVDVAVFKLHSILEEEELIYYD